MVFDQIWDRTHCSHTWGQYPNEGFTLFVARLDVSTEKRGSYKFLDLGCGQGSNAWFLAREGFDVTALDGSAHALSKLHDRLKKENLPATLVHADMTEPLPFPDKSFNAIGDIYGMCYGTPDEVESTVQEAYRVLVPGGHLYSMMPIDVGENQYFSGRGVVTFPTHLQIASWLKKFGCFSLGSTSSYDHGIRLNARPFVEWWTIEAVKGE